MPDGGLPGGPTADDSAVSVERGYEVRDTNIRGILLFAVGLAVTIIIFQVGLWAMLKSLNAGAPDVTTGPSMPVTAIAEYERLRSEEAGLVGDPVDRAIARLVERGIPPVGTGKTETRINSHAGEPAPAGSVGPGTGTGSERSPDDLKKAPGTAPSGPGGGNLK